MKRLFVLLMLMAAAFAGCNSSSGNDDENNGGNNNGNGGAYTVSGSVKLTSANGAGISGVTVMLTGANTNLSASTDNNGNYSFANIAAGTYAVTPTKSNYTFAPASVPVQVSNVNVAVQTFVGTTSGGNNNGSGGTTNFFPMKLGATWNYEETYDFDGFQSTSTYTDKIVGSMSKNGKTYWMLESMEVEDTYSYGDTTLVRAENNVIYSFFSADMFTKPAPKQAKALAAKMAKVTRTMIDAYGAEIAWLKFGVSNGTTWTVYDTGVYQGSYVKIVGKYLGTESVTVSSGTYAGCAKIEGVMTSVYHDTEDNQDDTSTTTQTMWFAPGVGMVKSVDVTSVKYGDMDMTYNSTIVLKSHSGL